MLLRPSLRAAAALLLLGALLLSAGPGRAADTAASAGSPARFISVRGTQLIGADGQAFAIKGINLGNWLTPEGYMFKFERAKSPRRINTAVERVLGPVPAAAFWAAFRERYVSGEDVRFIRGLGFNTVRVPLHWALFMTAAEPPAFEGPGWPLLDRLIGWCREAGLAVILDLHAAPGGQTGINHDDGPGVPLLFYVPRQQRRTVALWRRLAERYRDEPAVLGYDLLNEPIAPYHDTVLLAPRLQPFYRRITAAVREVDANHLVFLAGSEWSTSFAAFGRPFDDKAVYTYHKFWSATDRSAIREYLEFSKRWRVPIFLGESGELTDAWTRDFRVLHDRHGIGWSFWTYKNLDTGSSVVSIARPPGWASVVAIADGKEPRARGALAEAAAAERATAAAALAAYLDNLELARCTVNRGYVEALGLRVPPAEAPPAAGAIAAGD